MTTFQLAGDCRNNRRVGILAIREGQPHERLMMNRRQLADRLEEILDWITARNDGDRPATQIIAEVGIADLIFRTAVGTP